MYYTIYSKQSGHQNPKTLDLVRYVDAIDKGTLTPITASLGFMTYAPSPLVDPLVKAIEAGEDRFIAEFRKYYVGVYPEIAVAFDKDPIEAARVSKARLKAKFKKANFTSTIVTALRKSAATGDYVPVIMPSPLLQLNGVTGIPYENRKAKSPLSIVTPQSGATPTFDVTPTTREAAKLNMLRSMRIPLEHAWTFYHDKHADGSNYEGRLTELHADIVTLKKFWEVINGFPFEKLKVKDSVHYFKRSVKPVWEDARNVNGGSFSIRVPEDKAVQTYTEILLLAIGESFADVIQKGKWINNPWIQDLPLTLHRRRPLRHLSLAPLQRLSHHRLESRQLQPEIYRRYPLGRPRRT